MSFRDPYDQYSLTLKMFSVGSHSLEHMDLIRIARPIAEELAETTGETVHMGILEEDAATYVLKIESKYTIRMHSRIGKSIPTVLYCYWKSIARRLRRKGSRAVYLEDKARSLHAEHDQKRRCPQYRNQDQFCATSMRWTGKSTFSAFHA